LSFLSIFNVLPFYFFCLFRYLPLLKGKRKKQPNESKR